MNADGSNQTRLTFALASYDVLPAWSPDGTKVAFMSNRDGNEEIYVLDVASGVEANLTNAPLYGDSYPDWQPSPIDSTPPVLTVPETISMNATSPAGTQVTYTVAAIDNVDPNPTVTCTPPSGSTFQIGTTTVNCTATDASGNTANASFTVHVKGAAEQLADLGDAVKGVGPGKSLAVKVGIAEMVRRSRHEPGCLPDTDRLQPRSTRAVGQEDPARTGNDADSRRHANQDGARLLGDPTGTHETNGKARSGGPSSRRGSRYPGVVGVA